MSRHTVQVVEIYEEGNNNQAILDEEVSFYSLSSVEIL